MNMSLFCLLLPFIRIRNWILRKTRKYARLLDDRITLTLRRSRSDFILYARRLVLKRVKWSKEKERKFDEFWIKNYGRRISPDWHRYYEATTGVFDVSFMPSRIFSPELLPALNEMESARFCEAKTNLSLFFDDGRPVRCVPRHYGYKIRDYYYDGERNIVTKEVLAERLANVGECVFKRANDMQGHGFCFYNFQNGKDVKTGQTALEILNSTQGGFVFQERIYQHSAYAHLSPKSLNTVRISTFVCEGKVYHSPIAIRFGVGDSVVDNFHAGGIGIGVSDEGVLNKTGWRSLVHDVFEPCTVNPNNGELLEGYRVPYMDRIIEFAEKNHGKLPGIGVISWDLVVTEEGNPIVIEVNVSNQNLKFPQYMNGAPFFGEKTDKMLHILKKRRPRK